MTLVLMVLILIMTVTRTMLIMIARHKFIGRVGLLHDRSRCAPIS